MEEEEEKLQEERMREEEKANQEEQAMPSLEVKFSKLDDLLTQTQLYSEFLLEKMEDITFVLFLDLLPKFYL